MPSLWAWTTTILSLSIITDAVHDVQYILNRPSDTRIQRLSDDKLSKVISDSGLLSLHRTLVETASISDNEHDVGQYVADLLERHNYTVTKQEVPHMKDNTSSKPRYNIYAIPDVSKFDRAGVQQEESHRSTPKVLLTSHIDTVPPFIPYSLSLPKTKSEKFLREKILISGRGTVDDKACVAAQITAVTRLLHSADFKGQPSDLALLFVVGEEVSGDGMLHFSNSDLYQSTKSAYKAVIFGEPTESKLASGHKGIINMRIIANGKAAHSGYPWLGRSATSMILPALLKLDQLGTVPEDKGGLPSSELFGNTTVNVGYIQGGVASNVVPEYAEARIALRLAAGTPAQIREIVTKTIHSVDQDKLLEISFSQGYGPVYLDDDVPGFETITVNYGTDVPNLKVDKGVKRYLFGPGSILVAHGANEGLTVGDLESAVDHYETLIKHALDA